MESLGIGLATVSLVAIGAIVALAWKLFAEQEAKASGLVREAHLLAANKEANDALRTQEIRANKEASRADKIEEDLMALASVAGEPAVRGKLHQIWTDRIRATNRQDLRAVRSVTDAGAKPVSTDGPAVSGGAVPDFDEFAGKGADTTLAPAGTLGAKYLGKVFKR